MLVLENSVCACGGNLHLAVLPLAFHNGRLAVQCPMCRFVTRVVDAPKIKKMKEKIIQKDRKKPFVKLNAGW